MKHILGISAFYHDSAAALVSDGRIVAAAHEERFTRVKGDAGFPARAVEYCLAQAGIAVQDVDYVAFYEKPMVKFDRLLETSAAFAPRGYDAFAAAMPIWSSHRLRLPEIMREALGDRCRAELLFADHHESHAASAFFPSSFREAAVLTLDAVGEWTTSSIGVGREHRIELSRELRFPHSLGLLYSAFTAYTGFKVNSGEYKVMGLAPYGQPRYLNLLLDRIVEIGEDGSVRLDMSYFDYCAGVTMSSEKLHRLFGGPPREPESFLTQKHMDIAASVQALTDEVVLRAARYAHSLHPLPCLAMAGGVALNCVANGKLLRQGPFRELWIQPAAGDAGGALGAALLVWHHVLSRPRPFRNTDAQQGSLLGPSWTDEDAELYLDSVGATYERIDDEDLLLDRVARLMADEKVVGWFQGRMEYGPRALGSRSIVGDARSPQMQQTMNLKIKFRESFRPFAPCVLREYADQVFEMQRGEESPYMLLVAPVREEWRIPLGPDELERMSDPDLRTRVSVARSRIPAVTHVDYSARVQTVDEPRHGRFYRLMRRFHEITGCPVIVNTSFNVRGEPIVCTPQDAFRCFMATEMDCLALGNLLLSKEQQPLWLQEDGEVYRARYTPD